MTINLPNYAQRFRVGFAVALSCLLLAPDVARAQQRAPTASEPEAASGLQIKPLATATRFMVSAANPLAVDAGVDILKRGGSAVDAAIAVQLVLNLVEPQSSGLGGGAFLLHYDQRRKALTSIDGRETAPAAAKPDRFLKADGAPRAFPEAVHGGQSVGVPGVPRLMALAHARHGKLPWSELFQPALALAENGFPVPARLHALLKGVGAKNFDAASRALYFDETGAPRSVGSILKNPAFAQTLRTLAQDGAETFYTGPLARALVDAVSTAPNHQGDLTAADLAGYKAVPRPVTCTLYRRHKVCGMGPPSSGGLVIAQTLALLEPFDLGRAPMSPRALHLIAEAQKLAYADRDRYVADPDQVAVPTGLLDKRYLATRRKSIDETKAAPKADAGTPPGLIKRAGVDASVERAGTTHISIVDRAGNAVALTSSIENAFGARVMVGGMLLNNQLTDFSFRPRDAEGTAIANAVGPGKRPRSSMAPTIIFDPAGRIKAVLGSPGGSRIPLFVTKAIIGLIDWRLDAQAAVDLANFGNRNGATELEANWHPPLVTADLLRRGHQVVAAEMTSGLHVIVRGSGGRLEGGADARREGVSRGD